MVDDPHIWRAANLLVKRHGAGRADELLVDGDTEGCSVWKHILKAVAELTRIAPAEGDRVN